MNLRLGKQMWKSVWRRSVWVRLTVTRDSHISRKK